MDFCDCRNSGSLEQDERRFVSGFLLRGLCGVVVVLVYSDLLAVGFRQTDRSTSADIHLSVRGGYPRFQVRAGASPYGFGE